MAITRIQTAPASAPALTDVTLTFPSPPTVGNTLVVLAFSRGTSTAPTATDNRGNIYTQAALATQPDPNAVILRASVTSTGSPLTVTVQRNGGTVSAVAIELSGSLVVDQTVGNHGVATTPSTGTTAALTTTADVFVATAVGGNSTEASITVGVASPVWTQEFEILSGANLAYGEADSRLVPSATGTTQSASWTWPTNAIFAAVLAAFKAAAAAPTPAAQTFVILPV